MKIRVRHDQMEEIEGLQNEYPYAFHHVELSKTLVPWHWHEALEFNFIVSGSVKVSTPGRTLTFSQNQGFFMNSNILATMVNVDSCVMDSHLFHPVLLSGHFKSVFETKYLHPITQNKQVDIIPLRGETAAQRQLLQKLRTLSLLQKEADSEFQTRNLLSDIWLLLLRELQENQQNTSGTALRNQDRILTMMAFIQDHFAEKLTLEDIADSAAISTRECLRCFRSSIRKSPMEYLLEYRIGAAGKLLEGTDLSVTEIALRTGFNSPAYFSKQFKTVTGKTPNSFRKAAKALQKQLLPGT